LLNRMTHLLPRTRYVFIRGLCSIEEETFLVPEMEHDHERELVMRMVENDAMEIEYKPGGIFPDNMTRMVAYPRGISRKFPCISAGHRLSDGFIDNGPENILTNPRQGRIWDFYFNALVEGGYVETLYQKPTRPTDPDTRPLEDLMAEMDLGVDQETNSLPELPPAIHTVETLRTELSTPEIPIENLEPIRLEPSTSISPERGHFLEMICKLVYSLDLDRGVHDDLLVDRAYRSLYGIIPPTLPLEKMVEEVFFKLGLGVLFLRRVFPGNKLTSFRCMFATTPLGRPKFGFVLLESLPGSLDLITRTRLLSYRASLLIHPSDPILPLLYEQKLNTVVLERETKLSPSVASRTSFETFGERKSWPTIHRLFISYPYLQTPRNDSLYESTREYVEYIRTETTDNKAMYLVTMSIPKRFEKQFWAKELQRKIDRARERGIAPLNYTENTEEHIRTFMKMVEMTDKAKRELKETGDSFLFDGTLPGNIYGSAYMNIRNTI